MSDVLHEGQEAATRQLPPLTRATTAAAQGISTIPGGAPAPVRIVHLGLGAFHRAHQAWYTARAADAADWGIASFTGRSARAAEVLAAQDGLYTLIERGDDRDRATIIGSISQAHDGADLVRLAALLAAPRTAIVTLTVTEPGYRQGADGTVDLADSDVAADLGILREIAAGRAALDEHTRVTTSPARLLLGLWARRRAGTGPIAVVPCDNIPANGPMVRRALLALAEEVDPGLAQWMERQVSFVSTSVDRITPRTTDDDRVIAGRLTGLDDRAPVVTEPFSDWVLCGDFPAGRPEWESAGARFVDDIEPYERRKLWLLNGAHSLLAYVGLLRGRTTVAQAIADPWCRAAVSELWAEASRDFPPSLQTADYCQALIDRFSNARIEHRLDQIGMEGTAKLAVRIVPVALAERSRGRSAVASAEACAAWALLALRGQLPTDAKSDEIARATTTRHPTRDLVAILSPRLAADGSFMDLVDSRMSVLSIQAGG